MISFMNYMYILIDFGVNLNDFLVDNFHACIKVILSL